MNQPPLVLVVGLGNTLRGDDAFGRVAAQRVGEAATSPSVQVISQAAPTPELAALMAGTKAAIFLDASADGPPGEVWTRPVAQAADFESMSHRLGPAELLALSHRLYGHAPAAFALTFRGRSFDVRDCQLSEEAEAACDIAVQRTLELIDSFIECT